MEFGACSPLLPYILIAPVSLNTGVRLWHDTGDDNGQVGGGSLPASFLPLHFLRSHVGMARIEVLGHQAKATLRVEVRGRHVSFEGLFY